MSYIFYNMFNYIDSVRSTLGMPMHSMYSEIKYIVTITYYYEMIEFMT